MKNKIITSAVAILTLFSFLSWAGERAVGTLTITSSRVDNVVALTDGGTSGFSIAGKSLLTIQPQAAPVYVCINQVDSSKLLNCATTNGLLVPAGAALPTSCPATTSIQLSTTLSDGGTLLVPTPSCIVSIVQADGGLDSGVTVFVRDGTEF